MVRNYEKKNTRNSEINEESMSSAVNEVMEGQLSFRKAANKYNIKPTTLQSRIQKIRSKLDIEENTQRTFNSKYTSTQVFSRKEESLLNEYIVKCSKQHYGLTITQVRKLAYEFAAANNIKHPSNWDQNKMTGVDWMHGFRKRNANLSLRKPENTSAARSFGFNKTAVNEFYKNLESLYNRYKFTSDRIFNFDESGISTVLNTPKILAEKTQKQVGQLVSAERGELLTFGAIISASGNTIPPLFVFPRVHFKGAPEASMEGAPEGSIGVANKSGWINSDIFVQVLKHIQKFTLSSKDNPILLLCDNHESHVTLAAINYARENGIIYLSFPPHTSHRLQPLDVGVFGPFKSKLKTAFNDWHVTNPGKTLNIYNIPKLAKIGYFESFTAKNILSGFSKPGIWPFNKLAFSDEEFAPVQVYQSSESTSDIKDIPLTVDQSTDIPIQDGAETPINILGTESTPQISQASTSNLITPELVRPYPKIEKKNQTKKGRQPGKSRIYTDTPEKDRIEEMDKIKMMKKMEKERRLKAKEKKRALSFLNDTDIEKPKLIYKKTKTISESSESDVSISLRGSSTSSLDVLDETETEVRIEVVPENIDDSRFILVKFEKKKTVLYYVGQVQSHYSETEYKVSFLRKKSSTWTFVFPAVTDEAMIDIADVVLILPDPISSTTARTSNLFNFLVDLTSFNVQ